MYTDLKNVSILISLLKQYNIRHLVISAGTRHIPLVFSVEQDDFFTTYSVVDERSASFFALGLIEKLRCPVAVVCTSGTAACNYVSAVNEAYYQQLPLVVLTADRNNYYTNQQEEQMVVQPGLYGKAVRRCVNLPVVRDEKDAWYCARLVNEALLELDHRVSGPVHINFPVEDNYPLKDGIFSFGTDTLPKAVKINRLTASDSREKLEKKVRELKDSRVLIFYGQYKPIDDEEKKQIERFVNMFNCVVSVDLLANMRCSKAIFTYPINSRLTADAMQSLMPDIVITMNAHTVSLLKARLKGYTGSFRHWHISRDGEISDPFRAQTDIMEFDNKAFFKAFSDTAEELGAEPDDSYFRLWSETVASLSSGLRAEECELPFSETYIAQQFIPRIPSGSLLHLANSNSVRVANYFMTQEGVEVYCNRGTHGIDGSMSAFIGQSNVCDGLCFLLIGDLSFFYDMNALWNRYAGSNVRILVMNNSGGAIFHAPYYRKGEEFKRIDRHIAAAHCFGAKEWAQAAGFEYLKADDKESLGSALDRLFSESDRPILVEAFTDKDVDADTMMNLTKSLKQTNASSKLASKLPQPAKKALKKILGKG
ncbi:MAG: 2-succinyl-5-enolpyruvyl-6-hydroxy-3-cyclohexene-1-carboxylic-acid synthase [Ruminococcus sp.]|nr:2-succinyl-5-enolpyruvyl-6-hydroxy-3-cyclohexene-1-carboxylic-acid synthase [Ruminococcus sp.]